MVEGQFGNGKKVAPTIGRESDVSGRENRKEMVFPCADRALCSVGSVVEGRDALILDRGIGSSEESS